MGHNELLLLENVFKLILISLLVRLYGSWKFGSSLNCFFVEFKIDSNVSYYLQTLHGADFKSVIFFIIISLLLIS